jgi:hypothetical protein
MPTVAKGIFFSAKKMIAFYPTYEIIPSIQMVEGWYYG